MAPSISGAESENFRRLSCFHDASFSLRFFLLREDSVPRTRRLSCHNRSVRANGLGARWIASATLPPIFLIPRGDVQTDGSSQNINAHLLPAAGRDSAPFGDFCAGELVEPIVLLGSPA